MSNEITIKYVHRIVVGISAFIILIGLFMIGFISRKQGLHNQISRTNH